jgi:hypothetical protein
MASGDAAMSPAEFRYLAAVRIALPYLNFAFQPLPPALNARPTSGWHVPGRGEAPAAAPAVARTGVHSPPIARYGEGGDP